MRIDAVQAPEPSTELATISAIQEAEEKRTANKKHRAKIEAEAFAALEECVGVLSAFEAIREGRIPHVTIQY